MRATSIRLAIVALLIVSSGCTINIGTSSPPTTSPSPIETASPPVPVATGTPASEVVGSGVVKTESRTVSGFHKVRFSGSGSLLVDRSGSESLTIEAEDNILPLLTSEVVEGELRLGLRPGSRIVTYKPIVFRLTAKDLDRIQASGSGDVDAKNIDTDSFEFEGSGSTESKLAGRARQQHISLSGSGDFNGEALAGDEATIEVSGSADAVVNASSRLDVRLSGSSDVLYLGNPRVSQRVSGSGSVSPK